MLFSTRLRNSYLNIYLLIFSVLLCPYRTPSSHDTSWYIGDLRHERKQLFIDSVAHLATKRLEPSALMTWLDIFIAHHISTASKAFGWIEPSVKYCETWKRTEQLWYYWRDILKKFRRQWDAGRPLRFLWLLFYLLCRSYVLNHRDLLQYVRLVDSTDYQS